MEHDIIKIPIVITSIFDPTEAIALFSKFNDYQVIVVEDKKTPPNWNLERIDYISIDDQGNFSSQLVKIHPYNHYSRKMIGLQ